MSVEVDESWLDLQKAHLPKHGEESGRVVADSNAQPLRVVALQDMQRLAAGLEGRRVPDAVPLKICTHV